MYLYSYYVNIFKNYATRAVLSTDHNLMVKPNKECLKTCLTSFERCFQTSATICRTKETTQLIHHSFFKAKNRDKDNFLAAINKFRERERHLRGHVEFIYSAMEYMEEFGVHKDLETYKTLLDLMPKGKMIPTNIFQEEFGHYPKHQDCAIDVLEKMSNNAVLPDTELQIILMNTFGKRGRPVLKIGRMMYWMPKFKHASPWPLPEVLPNDALELAVLALIQINSVDPASKVTIMQTKDVEDSIEDTWIVSAISPTQQELISQHTKHESIKVEGPFGVFLRDQRIFYFVLRAEAKPSVPRPKRSEIDDVRRLFVWVSEEGSEKDRELIKMRSIHEQEDGVILATCATGTSSRDSLLSWIRLLEKSAPSLCDIPILFTQSSPIGDVVVSPRDKSETSVEEPQTTNA